MSSRVVSLLWPSVCTAVLLLPGCGPPPATDETDPLPHPFNNQDLVIPSGSSNTAEPVPVPAGQPKGETGTPEQPESGSTETRSQAPEQREERG